MRHKGLGLAALLVLGLSPITSARGDFLGFPTAAEGAYSGVWQSLLGSGDLLLTRAPRDLPTKSPVVEVVIRIQKVFPPGARAVENATGSQNPKHYSSAAPLKAEVMSVGPPGLFAQLEKILEDSPGAGKWPDKPLRDYIQVKEFDLTEAECPPIRRVVDSFHDLETRISIWGTPPSKRRRYDVAYHIMARGPFAHIDLSFVSGNPFATWAGDSIDSILACANAPAA
jgi:hypothetical protein